MSIGPLLLIIVLTSTLIINYLNNRCPNCKKWQIKGFNRLDEEIIGDVVKVYCPKCDHKWDIKFKKTELKLKKGP